MKSGSKQSKVKTVMKEWKEGKLKSSSGDKVTNPKQAVAIALSEAGLSKKTKGGHMAKSKKLFGGKETYGEELAEAKSVKSGKTSPSEFVKGEKSEGHKGEEKNLSKQAKDIKSGKTSPESYAKMEASEPEGKRGGGAIMSSKKSTMGVALNDGGSATYGPVKKIKLPSGEIVDAEDYLKDNKDKMLEKKRGGGAIMKSKKSTMGEALRGGGAIMASKRSTMGAALSTGGEVKGTGVAIKGIRAAKMC